MPQVFLSYTVAMKKKEESSWAETIGKGYAHVQHGLDRVIGWGFEKMRDADKPTPEPSGKIAAAGKKALSFFGTAGDAYYKTYDKLKNKK